MDAFIYLLCPSWNTYLYFCASGTDFVSVRTWICKGWMSKVRTKIVLGSEGTHTHHTSLIQWKLIPANPGTRRCPARCHRLLSSQRGGYAFSGQSWSSSGSCRPEQACFQFRVCWRRGTEGTVVLGTAAARMWATPPTHNDSHLLGTISKAFPAVKIRDIQTGERKG